MGLEAALKVERYRKLSLIDYRPSKVSIGKRKRWREPGGFNSLAEPFVMIY